MQSESKLPRSCVLRALRLYSTTVQDMEQTIMLPSLLREVLCEEPNHHEEEEEGDRPQGDLYECYLTLKAVRAAAESSLAPVDECRAKAHQALGRELDPLLDTDPEAAFYFHLQGLLSVIGCLTTKAQTVTAKYMQIVGISN